MFQIGPYQFRGEAWLAPLAAVSSAPYRQICLDLGCEQAVTEMVASEALARGIRPVRTRLVRAPRERVLIVQLFGGDPLSMTHAAQIAVQEAGANIIDINMGCPVRKILNVGAGVALMREPERAEAIVRAVYGAVGNQVPVTVKMRAGWGDELNAVEIAQRVVGAGASAVAIHGRVREQFHGGEASWDIIRQVKQAVHVPVIGNGGIRTPEQAHEMKTLTGCDAVMIGRASLGNPWVFKSLAEGREYVPSITERFEVMRLHVDKVAELMGDHKAAREMRKHMCWYLRGLAGSAVVRAQLHNMTSTQAVLDVLGEFETALRHGHVTPSTDDFCDTANEEIA